MTLNVTMNTTSRPYRGPARPGRPMPVCTRCAIGTPCRARYSARRKSPASPARMPACCTSCLPADVGKFPTCRAAPDRRPIHARHRPMAKGWQRIAATGIGHRNVPGSTFPEPAALVPAIANPQVAVVRAPARDPDEEQTMSTPTKSSRERGYSWKWEKARKRFLFEHPTCAMCRTDGRLTAAGVVDHIVPHKGDQALFWLESNWQSLCRTCHNSRKQRQEHGKALPGCTLAGTPTDPAHPWNRV